MVDKITHGSLDAPFSRGNCAHSKCFLENTTIKAALTFTRKPCSPSNLLKQGSTLCIQTLIHVPLFTLPQLWEDTCCSHVHLHFSWIKIRQTGNETYSVTPQGKCFFLWSNVCVIQNLTIWLVGCWKCYTCDTTTLSIKKFLHKQQKSIQFRLNSM